MQKILFVCTINKMRSATADEIYDGDERFEVASAGTSSHSRQVLTHDLLEWADAVVVMERQHRNRIREKFPDIYAAKPVVCLYIPDEYDFMEPELIDLLRSKFEDVYRRGLLKPKVN